MLKIGWRQDLTPAVGCKVYNQIFLRSVFLNEENYSSLCRRNVDKYAC